MRFITISGFSGSGKSSLISQIIKDFSKRGLKTCVVKSAEEIEIKKHEARFIKSGAKVVVVLGPEISLTVFDRRLRLKDLSTILSCDFLLLEGFKRQPLPRIVVARNEEEALKLIDEWTIGLTSLQKSLNIKNISFYPPEEIPELLLDKAPYFPLWTDCGLCGYKDCVSFLRSSIFGRPLPCPAARRLNLQ